MGKRYYYRFFSLLIFAAIIFVVQACVPPANNPPTAVSSPTPPNGAIDISLTLTLKWDASTDPDGDPVKYDIYLWSNPESMVIKALDFAANSYTISQPLDYGTKYYWKVVAKDGKGGETEGPVWNFTTKTNRPPESPSIPYPANDANNISTTPALSWGNCTDPDGDTVKYDVLFGEYDQSLTEIATDLSINNFKIKEPLKYDTKYWWKVIAKDENGGQSQGAIWTFTTSSEPNTPPIISNDPAPANRIADVSNTPVLSWNSTDPDGDILTYDIYFGTDPTPTLVLSNHTDTKYNPGVLKYNTTYYWKIVAKDGKGGLTEGSVWSFRTILRQNTLPAVPSDPTPADGKTGLDVTIILSWKCSDPDGDELIYDIYFGTDPTPRLVKSDQTSPTYTSGTLSYSTRYYWKIVAKDGKGGETSSPVWSFVTKAKPNTPPQAPNSPTPANGLTNVDISPTLSWQCSDPDSDTLIYDIYFAINSTPTTIVKSDQTSPTYTPGTLPYSTNCSWRIEARDGKGGEVSSPVWSFTTMAKPNTAPSKPSVLSPVNGENGVSVTQKLSWTSNDPDGDSLTYDVYFGTSATPTLASSDQTDATYVPAKMYYNTTYYWKVVAMDGKGGVSEGDVWRFTTEPEPNTPPTMPSNPNPADNKNETSITPTLSWQCSDPDGDALKYDVYFGTSSSLSTPVKKDQTSATYTPDVLEYSTRYYWKIIAKDGKGEETSSPVWSFVTMAKPNTAPVAPNALTPANESNNVDITSTLSWVCSDPDSDTLMYDIYFGTSSTPPLVKEDFSDTTYNPGRLLYSTTYYWKIVAKDGRGGETHSMVWSFTTGPEPNTVPSKPRNPAPTNGSTNIDITSPTLFWVCNDPDGDPLTYDIYFGTNPNPTLKVSNQAGTTYNPGTLSYNTMYYWKIVAIDGKGGITEGDVWNFKTGIEPNAAPVAPNSPTPRNGLTNVDISPTLSWQCSDPDSDTLMYDVYFDTKPDPTLVKSDQTSSAYNPGVLNYNTTYYWKIVAKDGKGGVTSSSPVWHFVTKAKPNTPPQVPNNPVPVNKAIDVSATSTLSWECSDPDSDTLMYDVYFGTSSTPPLVKNDSTVTTYDPGILNNSTRYYWKIVAKDDKGGVTSSPVWSFTTIWKPGAINWQFVTYAVIYSSPALGTDGTIYIGSWDKKLYAIYPDGTKKWEFATGGSISSSPAIGLDGTIYVGCEDGYLYAINPNGTEKWKFTTGGSISSSPAIGANGIIYVGSEGGNLYAIYPNGTQKWEFATGGGISSSPAIGTNGVIYVGSENGKLYAINPNRTQKWEFAAGGSISSSPAIDSDDTIYVATFDGILYALNQGGAKKWQSAIGSYVESSPVIGSDGTIYIGSYDHRIYAIDSSNGATKWTFDTNGQITSTPAIGSDGVVYVGSNDGNLYAIDPNAGGDKKKWEVFIGGCAYSSPSIASDGTVYIGSLDGNLYAIKSDSTGLANSPWPKFRRNLRSTGNASEQ